MLELFKLREPSQWCHWSQLTRTVLVQILRIQTWLCPFVLIWLRRSLVHLWSSKVFLANMLKTSTSWHKLSGKCKHRDTSREAHFELWKQVLQLNWRYTKRSAGGGNWEETAAYRAPWKHGAPSACMFKRKIVAGMDWQTYMSKEAASLLLQRFCSGWPIDVQTGTEKT